MIICPSCTDPNCRGEQMHVPGSVSARVETPSALGKRRALDDYPTPAWVIGALAPYLGDLTGKTGDDWYRSRGMCPPQFKERHEIEADAAVVPTEPRTGWGAFDDLLAETGE